jgi:hypothetical protein
MTRPLKTVASGRNANDNVESHVEVVILSAPEDEFADYIQAVQSSTDFWDNPIDDAEWNDA